jgi:hypothetical protein
MRQSDGLRRMQTTGSGWREVEMALMMRISLMVSTDFTRS